MTAKLKLVSAVAPESAGGYFVSEGALARFGSGDPKRGRRYLRLLLADEREPEVDAGPTDRPANVRWAYQRDEKAIIDLIEADCKREAPDGALISRQRISECVEQGTRGKLGVVGAIDGPRQSDGIVACVVLFPVQPLFSETRYVHEAFHVVHHDHRKSRHAEDLLNFAKWATDEWSKPFGHRLHLIYTVNARLSAKEKIRFFRRHMQQIGGTFIYPPLPE